MKLLSERTILVLVAWLLPAFAWAGVTAHLHYGLTAVIPMSSGHSAVLFRADVFRDEVQPAYRAFIEKHQTGPVLKLLRRARPQAPAKGPGIAGAAEGSALAQLQREAAAAAALGDEVPAQEFPDRAWELVRPNGPDMLDQAQVDQAVAHLERAGASDPESVGWVKYTVRGLAELLCVPWKEHPSPAQEVASSMLGEYLEARSEWLTLHLIQGGPRGPELQLPGDEWIGVYGRDELLQLQRELSSVERPPRDGLLRRQFDTLRSIVDVAARDRTYVLAWWSR